MFNYKKLFSYIKYRINPKGSEWRKSGICRIRTYDKKNKKWVYSTMRQKPLTYTQFKTLNSIAQSLDYLDNYIKTDCFSLKNYTKHEIITKYA